MEGFFFSVIIKKKEGSNAWRYPLWYGAEAPARLQVAEAVDQRDAEIGPPHHFDVDVVVHQHRSEGIAARRDAQRHRRRPSRESGAHAGVALAGHAHARDHPTGRIAARRERLERGHGAHRSGSAGHEVSLVHVARRGDAPGEVRAEVERVATDPEGPQRHIALPPAVHGAAGRGSAVRVHTVAHDARVGTSDDVGRVRGVAPALDIGAVADAGPVGRTRDLLAAASVQHVGAVVVARIDELDVAALVDGVAPGVPGDAVHVERLRNPSHHVDRLAVRTAGLQAGDAVVDVEAVPASVVDGQGVLLPGDVVHRICGRGPYQEEHKWNHSEHEMLLGSIRAACNE